MLESPTMTCSRRYFSGSAWGSSRVLMIGRLRVVAEEIASQMCSARWLIEYAVPLTLVTTLPAPVKICRLMRYGMKTCSSRREVVDALDAVVLVAAVGVARSSPCCS